MDVQLRGTAEGSGDVGKAEPLAPGQPTRRLIAPVWHTVVLLAVFAALAVLGWLAQRSAATHAPGRASRLVPLQVQAIIFEWATVAWLWFGVRRKGVRVRELIAGRWPNVKAALVDLLLGGGLWALWLGVVRMERFFAGYNPPLDAIPFPVGLLETSLAVLVAGSAGICEEIVFRGYFQRQFHAMSGNVVLAVLLQAVVFGLPHSYEGFRLMILAASYGMLFGLLALWRKSLRPGMIAHVWSDMAARLLRIG